MSKNIILIFFTISVLTKNTVISKQTSDFYIGAVVEYANIFNIDKNPEKNILDNVREYKKFIKDAKNQNADIILFPEYGLTSTHISDYRQEALLYSSEIPNPKQKINLCQENKTENNSISTWSDILIELSCEAQENRIYVVINLPEKVYSKNNFQLFNTDIVFDRSGIIISRYRKYNLFKEIAFNSTTRSEISSFTTDFGVKFGLITCFDILHSDPTLHLIKKNKVTDILFPTAWMSQMPFLTAIQTQAGIVKAFNVNLLASNYDNPENFGGGSGIYSPISGVINYTIPDVKQSKLLVSKIPKLKPVAPRSHFLQKNNNYQTKKLYLNTFTINWNGFSSKLLQSNLNNYSLCNGNLCCNFTIKFISNQSDYFYRVVVSDKYKFEANKYHEQICGVVACENKNLTSCGKITNKTSHPKLFQNINITGNFSSDKNFLHFPSIVNYNLTTLPFSYYSYDTSKRKNGTKVITLKINRQVNKILGISIYGRSRIQ